MARQKSVTESPFQPAKKPGLWERLKARLAPKAQKAREDRLYQERLIVSVIGAFGKHKTVLLAACPNAGKTFMAGEIIGRRKPTMVKRVLVLAHATKVLRLQFLDDLKKYRPDLLPFVDVRIPQEIHRKNIENYDLVIVDEAHQFYGKGEKGDGKSQRMMATILRKARPKNVLLLTGSPAKFIADGFKADENMFCFSLEQLHSEQADAVADVMIECASSHYAIKDEDYTNTFGEVRKDFAYSQRATVATLDDVLALLLTRLKLSGDRLDSVIGKARYGRTKAGWDHVFGRMEKTILAVPSIKVAEEAGAYFKKNKISCLVSHSEDDVESDNIKKFKEEDDVRLLIVVNRAQLGFDHRELFHFIDMTGSKSPDRIFQMFCRVVRSSIDNPKRNKLFVKVMPRLFSEIQVRAFMSGVLSLAQQANFENWNGKGLSLLDVPVAREQGPRCPNRKKHEAGVKCEKCGATKCSLLHVIDVKCTECGKTKKQIVPVLESGMLVFGDYFKALVHNTDDPFCPYAMAKLGDVLGMAGRDPEGAKAAYLQFFDKHGRWAAANGRSEESLMACRAMVYVRANPDPVFIAAIRARGWLNQAEKTKKQETEFRAWVGKYGPPRPRSVSGTKVSRVPEEEWKLYRWGFKHRALVGDIFHIPTREEIGELHRKDYVKFCTDNGYRPYFRAGDEKERLLGRWFQTIGKKRFPKLANIAPTRCGSGVAKKKAWSFRRGTQRGDGPIISLSWGLR